MAFQQFINKINDQIENLIFFFFRKSFNPLMTALLMNSSNSLKFQMKRLYWVYIGMVKK